jgi:Desulfoferrodoxin, N-terminal domain
MLRRLHLLLAAVLLSLLALGGGATSAQGSSQGAENLAAGTGTLVCCGEPMVHVNAQSQSGGVDPRGHFWIRYPNGVEFGGPVVCLNVVGNVAGLIGQIERVKVAAPASGFVLGNYLRIRITDLGSPGTTDLANFDPGTPGNPGTCPGVGDLVISQGNYVVHDKPVVNLSALDSLLAQFEAQAKDPYG